ncbi:DUF4062 domain-containing protein [Vibrio harveyi]|uniref:DUF4062 domain-containing protein n=1 Tax=Vibrio harveyi TaxID=669 RepID=UPI0009380EE2|nr:DUF4062 domain-containing protein [Vibrio harveyi]APP04867.1 hypothetical protein BG259_05675 [Vibrio harveyi]
MDKKFQIFVSSTYEDLKVERDQVIKAILEMGHIPVGMEMFSAADEEQWKIIQHQIDESDYYVVISAHKYGSVASDGISYTEKEYNYALECSVPILGFVIAEHANWPSDKMEKSPDKRAALEEFKSKIKTKLVNFWETKDDLHAKVSIALMKTMQTTPRIGWIRSDKATASPELVHEMTRLSQENALLRKELVLAENAVKEKEEKTDDNALIFDILKKNPVLVYIYERNADSWNEPLDTTLLGVFKAIAPNLMVENSFDKIGSDVAIYFGVTNFRKIAPVPNNHLSHWLADLAALDLITPSSRKHPVSDKNEYWALSDKGAIVLKNLRRIQLEKGLVEQESPES